MSSEAFQPLQGMSDIAAPEIARWQFVESRARAIFDCYAMTEVRTPILERHGLYEHSLGETTDVVQKEMYAFDDRGGRRIALRPEGTASVVRYIGSLGQDGDDARLYYIGPMFRSERPQAGRKRQFHQIGVECAGEPCATRDAEVIALQVHLLRDWGINNFKLKVNTRGLPEDRRAVSEGLLKLLRPRAAELCEDCRRRLETNVLRVLDCKESGCHAIVETLPPVTSFMSAAASAYLDQLKLRLDLLDIPYVIDPLLIRGLDYYIHTVWEISHPGLGAQDALAGGGRYRMEVGGRELDGVGFAMGVERVLSALATEPGAQKSLPADPMVWVVSFGDAAFDENFRLVQTLRHRGIRCGMDLAGRSMKAQMRGANKAGAAWVVIRGDNELQKGTFQLKDMAAGTQMEVELPDLLARLKALNAQP